MRAVYSCCFYLLLPAIFLRLLWRGLKAPDYLRRWPERLAIYPSQTQAPVLWFHAVSVGEVEALRPLLLLLMARYPKQRLLITTTTPTGSARVKALFQDRVAHVYLPYDLPDAVGRFMRHFRPRLAVIMETEIWPNYYAYCSRNLIPLYLINARLSDASVRGYRIFPDLIRPALASVKQIAAQSQADVERFFAIGAPSDAVTNLGNIKFDVEVAPELSEQGRHVQQQLFAERWVWLLASSHKGEEAMLLAAYRQLKPRIPKLLLAIAPRHPERFQEVGLLCREAGLQVTTRGSAQACAQDTDVFLLDSLGELKLFYAAADVAFVGGSLVAVGGHNVLEPAAIGVPIMFGPNMDNFKQIAQGILAKNAAVQCHTPDEIAERFYELSVDSRRRQAMIANAKEFVLENQGVVEKLADLLAASIQP